MSQKAITIYTPASADPHIYAEDDAQIFRALFGGSSGITEADDALACSIINNNTVRLAPGVYSNQGFMVCVPGGSYEDLTIESGMQGMYRKDLIIADFQRGGGDTADTHVFTVVKGTAAASEATAAVPTLTQDDLRTGGNHRQEALYQINIDGLVISSIERVADYIGAVYQ